MKKAFVVGVLALLTALLSSCLPGEAGYINNPITSGTPGYSADSPIYVSSFNGTVAPHVATHENGGDDELSVAGLSGLLADDQHVLDTEVLDCIQNNALPAFTLGGTITSGGYGFELGSGSLTMTTSDSYGGIQVECTSGATGGAAFLVRHKSPTPANGDAVGIFRFNGRDHLLADTAYGQFRCVASDITNTTEDGQFQWYLMRNGTLTLAMTLDENGVLAVDDSYDTFDEFDDAELLREGISRGDKELLVYAGVLNRVPVSANSTDVKYTINLQRLLKLVAGGVYQNRDKIDALEARVAALEANKAVSLGVAWSKFTAWLGEITPFTKKERG